MEKHLSILAPSGEIIFIEIFLAFILYACNLRFKVIEKPALMELEATFLRLALLQMILCVLLNRFVDVRDQTP